MLSVLHRERKDDLAPLGQLFRRLMAERQNFTGEICHILTRLSSLSLSNISRLKKKTKSFQIEYFQVAMFHDFRSFLTLSNVNKA